MTSERRLQPTALGALLSFVERLREAKISHRLDSVRDAVMVIVDVPGERWEVEFFEDGEIDVERFISAGVERGTPERLESLFEQNPL